MQVEIESTDRQFSKEINVITCPHEVTRNYRVVDWNQRQAKKTFVDLLIGVDIPELHFSVVDFQGSQGEPVARRGPLGWTCIGPQRRMENQS